MTTPYTERLDVIVVGGSQTGLAMAWYLARHGLRFVVLDAGTELGEVWTSRWDSLKLFTSSEFNALPGMQFPGRERPDALPDGSVLVVGGGNSGFQIAEELVATRPVDLSIGSRYLTLPQRGCSDGTSSGG